MQKHILSTITLLGTCFLLAAQTAAPNFWRVVPKEAVTAAEQQAPIMTPSVYSTAQLDVDGMRQYLAQAPREFTEAARQPIVMSLLQADGSLEDFAFVMSPVVGQVLLDKYPEIRTYTGFSMQNQNKKAKITVSPYWGVKILIRRPDHGLEFVERMYEGSDAWYIGYDRMSLPAHLLLPPAPLTVEAYDRPDIAPTTGRALAPVEERGVELNCTNKVDLKIYRFACATTGEFAQDHGGTTATVLAAMVNYSNQLNAIYEGDLRIRLVLIDDVENILFLDPATDPYTGNTVGSHMNQNPVIMNTVLGNSDKYDIGHVFARYIPGDPAAGVAGGLCCTDFGKGRGCSSAVPPYGAYFLSVIGQEIGHQWDGGHTWTFCPPELGPGDSPVSACEPGSGSTIMSYAGVCATNVQNVADLYYHVCSIVQIRDFVENGFGNTCGTTVATDNCAPIVTIPYPNNLFLPISTPFELTGTAVDPDGDPMTYCWEQADRGPLVPIGQPTGNTPLFRTYPAVTSLSRTFPRIQTVINNTSSINEVLPTYSRDLTFCLTARDNRGGGSGVGIDTVHFGVTATAGPFLVTSPNTSADVWNVGEFRYVTWNVANTNGPLVNCKRVNIRLSTNGGSTYPITLATGVANTGNACILVPDNVSSAARIRVEAADNVFFDISNANFRIVNPTVPGFAICADEPIAQACLPSTFSTTVSNSAWANFNETITYTVTGLPTGATATWSQNPAPSGTDVQLSIDFGANPTEATSTLEIIANGSTLADTATLAVTTVNNDFSTLALLTPANGSSSVVQNPLLTWAGAADADRYQVQLASSPSFALNTILLNNNNVTGTSLSGAAGLEKGTVYYWRMRAVNACGETDWIGPFSFATLVESCQSYEANDLPKNISTNGSPTIESIINVPSGGTVSDFNVVNISGSHDAFNHLKMSIISPQGTELTLFQEKCGESSLFINAGFDDAASIIAFPCPPNGNQIIKPAQALSGFNGQNATGQWKLRVKDNAVGGGGSITAFSMEICAAATTNPPIIVTNTPLTVNNGASAGISASVLRAQDPDNTPEQLTYTLVSLPINGHVRVDAQGVLPIGGQFTQEDIDLGNVRYYDWGSSTAGDNFRFTVTDGNGGLAIGNFQINVNSVSAPDLNAAQSFRMAPNPANDQVRLTWSRELTEDARLSLFDAAGRQIRSQILPAGTLQHDLSVNTLPQGIYAVQISTVTGGVVTRKLVVQ
jgi:Metallo-peptidase family M12B Reprolysin-like/Cadherin-like/Secretion system C-terminal sorting domain/Proprotein convertase P-domain